MNITYSECGFVALVIQLVKRMLPVILSSVTCLNLQYYSTLSHTRHVREKNMGRKMCVLIFCINFFLNILHSKKN
jgi:hypothetical protein